MEEIDYTDSNTTAEENNEITQLQNKIQQLESMLKFPMSIKSIVAGSLLGYIFTKKYLKNENTALLASVAGGYAAFNLSKGRELTVNQKHAINEQIQSAKQRLQALGIEIKSETIGVLSANELEKLDYEKYVFGDDQYGEFIGNPAVGFHAIVFGLPKGGKSIWSMQFANYLANHFGEVLYIASEEGFKGTITQKITEWTDNRTNLDFANYKGFEEIRNGISGYNFVFIDSLDFAKITVDEMEDLKLENPSISFVTIKQVTKDGKFRGSQEYAHNCDIIIQIIDGVAHQKGRYNPAAEMEVFTKEEEFQE